MLQKQTGKRQGPKTSNSKQVKNEAVRLRHEECLRQNFWRISPEM